MKLSVPHVRSHPARVLQWVPSAPDPPGPPSLMFPVSSPAHGRSGRVQLTAGAAGVGQPGQT